jgi:hypothetical protein
VHEEGEKHPLFIESADREYDSIFKENLPGEAQAQIHPACAST